jgi:hypothetical protein
MALPSPASSDSAEAVKATSVSEIWVASLKQRSTPSRSPRS